MLPSGVLVARYYRVDERWYTVHRNLQTAGWVAQIVGFAFAYKYVEDDSRPHFEPVFFSRAAYFSSSLFVLHNITTVRSRQLHSVNVFFFNVMTDCRK